VKLNASTNAERNMITTGTLMKVMKLNATAMVLVARTS
jgi:hypothetical protein